MAAHSLEMAIVELKKKGEFELEEILLFWKKIGDDGVRKLFEAIGGRNESLKLIDLTYNDISDEGAILLAQMVAKCERMEIMNLSRNKITGKGCIQIAELVEKSSTLKALDLSDNSQIGEEGAVRMAEALKINTSLTKLRLRNCGISERGGRKFIETLEVNTTLKDVDLSGNMGGMKSETWSRVQTLSWAKRVRKSVPYLFPAEFRIQMKKKTSGVDQSSLQKIEISSTGKIDKELQYKEEEFRKLKKLLEEKDNQIGVMIQKVKRRDLIIKEKDVKIEHFEHQHAIDTMHQWNMLSRIYELEVGTVPLIPSSCLSFALRSLSSVEDRTGGRFLCFYGKWKVRFRMMNGEERWNGIHKWFIAGQMHPLIPRVFGIVQKEDIPMIEGIDHLFFDLGLDGSDADGIAIIDASMGMATLYKLLHHCGDDDHRILMDDAGKPLKLTDQRAIFSIAFDICSILVFLHNELGIVHGCVNSHSVVIRYSKEECRFVAQLRDVGLWSQSVMHDDRIRWIAPELIASDGSTGPSYESDVWAFGMLMEELLTGKFPFETKDEPSDIAVGIRLRQFGSHPPYFECPAFNDLISLCRLHVAAERPCMHEILQLLKTTIEKV